MSTESTQRYIAVVSNEEQPFVLLTFYPDRTDWDGQLPITAMGAGDADLPLAVVAALRTFAEDYRPDVLPFINALDEALRLPAVP